MIKGLIFDFDGLILDTETPNYNAWQRVYQSCGVDLPISVWCGCIGGAADSFNPLEYLQSLLPAPFDPQEMHQRYLRNYEEITRVENPLPGVREILTEGRKMGLEISIASSSPRKWVESHLVKMNLMDDFSILITFDDTHRVKPEPDLFLLAAQRCGFTPAEGIIFEDSPNGVLAANRAGIKCVAVPNPITALLDLSHADLIIEHLNSYPLSEIISKVSQ
jgi:HAD superfamily hydrolase (TIGR01509 family)